MLPIMRTFTLAILATISLPSLAMAAPFGTQNTALSIIDIDIDIDLPSVDIWSIAQDVDGFIWFATEGGLVRLDRRRLTTTYETLEADNGLISPQAVRSVVPDPNRGVWLAADVLKHVDPWTRVVTEYPLEADQVVGNDEHIWIWTANHVQLFDLASLAPGPRIDINLVSTGPDPIPMAISPAGNLFVSSGNAVTSISSTGIANTTVIPGGVGALTPRKGGGIWVLSPSGLWIMALGSARASRVSKLPNELEIGLPGSIMGLVELDDGSVLVAGRFSGTSGVAIYDPGPQEWTQSKDTTRDAHLFSYLFEDSSGRVWASRFGGISRIRRGSASFSQIQYEGATNGSLVLPPATGLAIRGETLFVAHGVAGLRQFNLVTQRWEMPPETFTDDRVQGILSVAATANRLWVGTDRGLFYLPEEGGPAQLVGERSQVVDELFIGSQGRVYASTDKSRLTIFDSQGRLLARLGVPSTSWVPSQFVKSGDATSDQVMLVADETLEVVNFRGQLLRKVTRNNDATHGATVRYIYPESPTVVWLTSGAGLERLDIDSGESVLVTAADGYQLTNIESVTPYDEDTRLLLATDDGLSVLDLETSSIVANFGPEDGLPSTQFGRFPGATDENGTLYLGSVDGITVIPPGLSDQDPMDQPQPFLRCREGCGHDSISSEIPSPGSLVFDFLSNDYRLGRQAALEYKMQGFDSKWHQVLPGATTVVYTGLPPGKYTMVVRAATEGDPEEANLNELNGYQYMSIEVTNVWWRNSGNQVPIVLLLVLIGASLTLAKSQLRRQQKLTLEATIADRTRELRIARKVAERANRAKGDALSIVGHDLRSPLSGILGYTDLLSQTIQNDNQNRFTDGIRKSTLHLVGLVDQLAINGGEHEAVATVMSSRASINDLIDESISFINPSAWLKDITVSRSLDQRLAEEHYLHHQHLRQILVNLMTNAIIHSNGTSIEVSCRVLGTADGQSQRLLFAVADNGGTLGANETEAIFGRHRRGQRATGGGFGLGLSISRDLVADQGGQLEVRVDPGRETRFESSFNLEVVEEVHPVAWRADHQDGPLVYVVDDDDQVRSLLTDMYEALGCRVRSFSGARSIVSELSNEHVDLISTDLVMYPMTGIELAKNLRRSRTDTPSLIAITGESIESVCASLFDRVLTKPVSLADLRSTLTSLGFDLAISQPANS